MSAFFEIPGLNIYLQIAVTLISIAVTLIRIRKQKIKESSIFIIGLFVFGLSGWFSIMSGLFGHIVYADQVATGIGWPLNSGFQMELGFASMAIGLVGFLSFWRHSYWLPFIIMKLIFGWGAGFTHILHMLRDNNFSPSNTGLVVYWDFLFPLFMLGLYLLIKSEERSS